MDKSKFLVPEELTMSQLTTIIRYGVCVCVCVHACERGRGEERKREREPIKLLNIIGYSLVVAATLMRVE